MALQRVVNSYGTVVVAAFTSTSRIEQLIHQPYATLGTSIATFCGQNFGAERHDRVYMGYRKGFLIMTVITLVMIFVMQVFGRAITSLFVSDAEVIALGTLGLRITSLFYLALGTIYVVRGVLTGMGDSFFALFNGIVEVIGRFTIPIFLTKYMGMGEAGIWVSSGVVWILSGSTAWLRFLTHFQAATRLRPREKAGAAGGVGGVSSEARMSLSARAQSSLVLFAAIHSAGIVSIKSRCTRLVRQGAFCLIVSVPRMLITTTGTFACFAMVKTTAWKGRSSLFRLRVPSG